MEILIVASLITSLLAGVAALFAPCCIGVLLPAYFASIFRQKKTVFLMTLVFFFGLLAVFLPLGLGFGLLGQILKQYHNLIYGIGAGFLFLLGMFILLGFHFSLPFQTKSQIKVTGMASFRDIFCICYFMLCTCISRSFSFIYIARINILGRCLFCILCNRNGSSFIYYILFC